MRLLKEASDSIVDDVKRFVVGVKRPVTKNKYRNEISKLSEDELGQLVAESSKSNSVLNDYLEETVEEYFQKVGLNNPDMIRTLYQVIREHEALYDDKGEGSVKLKIGDDFYNKLLPNVLSFFKNYEGSDKLKVLIVKTLNKLLVEGKLSPELIGNLLNNAQRYLNEEELKDIGYKIKAYTFLSNSRNRSRYGVPNLSFDSTVEYNGRDTILGELTARELRDYLNRFTATAEEYSLKDYLADNKYNDPKKFKLDFVGKDETSGVLGKGTDKDKVKFVQDNLKTLQQKLDNDKLKSFLSSIYFAENSTVDEIVEAIYSKLTQQLNIATKNGTFAEYFTNKGYTKDSMYQVVRKMLKNNEGLLTKWDQLTSDKDKLKAFWNSTMTNKSPVVSIKKYLNNLKQTMTYGDYFSQKGITKDSMYGVVKNALKSSPELSSAWEELINDPQKVNNFWNATMVNESPIEAIQEYLNNVKQNTTGLTVLREFLNKDQITKNDVQQYCEQLIEKHLPEQATLIKGIIDYESDDGIKKVLREPFKRSETPSTTDMQLLNEKVVKYAQELLNQIK